MAKPIYNENGTIEDWSDEGFWAKEMITEIDKFYLLKSFKGKEKEIAEMLLNNHTWAEIKRELNTYDDLINKVLRAIKSKMTAD